MPTSKCVSSCHKLSKDACSTNSKCNYVNGNTRKYCRLSNNFFMKKPNCKVTRKLNKRNATRVIGRALKSSGLFLHTICPNSGSCMAFGSYVTELTRYFDEFTSFKYLTSMHQIGVASSNGFIYELLYVRNQFKASAILKSAQNSYSDNLMYEYMVGVKYINRILKSFPCFVQTYGLYYYPSHEMWERYSTNARNPMNSVFTLQLQRSFNYENACLYSKYAAILVQHVVNPQSIFDVIQVDEPFVQYDLIYVLFVVYHALSSLRKSFTHHDLHHHNVLLYKKSRMHYLTYHYHHDDGTETSFCSMHIPKIIDYGRCYFNNGSMSSESVRNKACATNACSPRCGESAGFHWTGLNDYGIRVNQKNESHDLRLLNELKHMDYVQIRSQTLMELSNILKRLLYEQLPDKNARRYGTVEHLANPKVAVANPKNKNPKVANVLDAYTALKAAIEKPSLIRENANHYATYIKIGDLHIYDDMRPMKYEPQ